MISVMVITVLPRKFHVSIDKMLVFQLYLFIVFVEAFFMLLSNNNNTCVFLFTKFQIRTKLVKYIKFEFFCIISK